VPPEEILRATCRALDGHGYADLTMQAIAEESDLSKAALHYHYERKGNLLEAFLDAVAERFLDCVREAAATGTDPGERLEAVLGAALYPPEADGWEGFGTALLELRAQAPHEPAFSARIRYADAEFRAVLADVLEAGVESGQFRADLDPEMTARLLATTVAGANLRQVSVGTDGETARELVDSILDKQVYAGETA